MEIPARIGNGSIGWLIIVVVLLLCVLLFMELIALTPKLVAGLFIGCVLASRT